ncbi:MAG: hypothetical protein JNN00_17255, partial [Chitinophagaceae bacterium]|nr:hypothetical protein [Chitinophagaceae bacterium]
MSLLRNDIDNLFYDGIERHSEYPSEIVWHKVEAELDRKAADLYKRKYQAVKKYAVFLSFLVLGILIYELMKSGSAKQHSSAGTTGHQSSGKQNDESTATAVVTEQRNKLSEYPEPAYGSRTISTTGKKNGEEYIRMISAIIRETPVINEPEAETTNEIRSKENSTTITGDFEMSSRISDTREGSNIPVRPLLLTNDGKARINNLAGNPQLPLPPDFRLPLMDIATKRPYQSFSSSKFSLVFYASPGIAWNSIRDNKHHHRPRGGGNGGGGNNGGGNSGGGNGGGGNTGGGRGGRGDNRHDYIKNEQNGLTYYGGVSLHYQLSKRLFAETGLSYLASSTIINSKKIYAVRDNSGAVRYRLNSSSGYSYVTPQSTSSLSAGDSVVISRSKNTISYLSAPLTAGYKFLSAGRFSLAASAGGQVNILVKGKTTTHVNTDYRVSAHT